MSIIAAQSEHAEQAALVEACKRHAHLCPALENLFAIPNGGRRHVSVARQLKEEGVRPGVPDLFLAWPGADGSRGLFVEMKTVKGRLSPEQADWIARLNKAGYRVVVCYGFEQAWQAICRHVGLEVNA